MRVAGVTVVVVCVVGLVWLGDLAASSSRLPPANAPCAEAIYTSPADAPPRPVRAVHIGPAVFNSLAGVTSPRNVDAKPSKTNPFYSVKSPLTILAHAGEAAVLITIVRGGENAAAVYDRRWLRRLSNWRYRFAYVPRSVLIQPCRDTTTKQPLNTSFAGGFLLRKLGCITIEVRIAGESRAHRATVRIGVPRC